MVGDHERTDGEHAPVAKQKITAAQIKESFPAELEDLGELIAAHLEKSAGREQAGTLATSDSRLGGYNNLKDHQMVGTKGHSGGARPNTGGARENAGRPPDSGDRILSAARLISPAQKWSFAEKALQHAERALEVLVEIMEHGESEAARVRAAEKILDRALGKAPQHIDTAALRHTEIVYHTAKEIREALAARGVPPVLLDYTPPDNDGEQPDKDGEE
jgi:hypothetical protein